MSFPDPACFVCGRFRPAGFILLAALVLAGPSSGSASEPFGKYERTFGTVTLGIAGGFQTWGLDGLQDQLGERADIYAVDSYDIYDGGNFGPTYGYGAELQFRLTQNWYLRTQAEWTRMEAETRDRRSLVLLGGREPTSLSLTYTTRVQTRPLLFAVGVGRSVRFSSVRWGFSGSVLLAPVRVIDELEVFMSESTVSEVVSTGWGRGGEALVSLDYFTDTNMTLYVDGYYRRGATVVELEAAEWESSILPGRRRVDFDGIGVRLGFRWI